MTASDWDVVTPIDTGETPADQDNDANDGIFFAEDDQQNDSFVSIGITPNDGTPEYPRMEAQSFNPRPSVFFDQPNERNPTPSFQPEFLTDHNEAPIPKPNINSTQNYYKSMPNSYTDRKILEKESENYDRPYKRRYHGGGGHFRNQRNRMRSESDAPSSAIPHELLNDFKQDLYDDFHETALEQRTLLGIGKSQEMTNLFYFWCYYLRDSFNQAMYDEFLELARQDAAEKQHYAIECFFRFCSYGLEKRWDDQIFRQFQDEALADYRRGSTYGIEKVKAFLIHNKHDFPIIPSPEMDQVLQQYPTLESFKQNVSSPKKQEAGSVPRSRQLNTPENGRRRPPHQRNPKNDGKSPGNQNRQRPGQGGRNQAQSKEWTFGKMQPASAPKVESPDLRKNPKH